eukprot:CAMPEP_0204314972 /NCGR_PEP_ID=MMETSP0469-20131031/4550_1 /ASSEMBLY_ACC=CAM_ASM_000384 /TAXON_ID=2969 /ORGANISM="Oxyrrhis marina" /LENGTH=662 /DNA_ID=CAMNT_0051295555 /DNA_START=38 /DNA_END=2024 /DNA_ORIENTATION=-
MGAPLMMKSFRSWTLHEGALMRYCSTMLALGETALASPSNTAPTRPRGAPAAPRMCACGKSKLWETKGLFCKYCWRTRPNTCATLEDIVAIEDPTTNRAAPATAPSASAPTPPAPATPAQRLLIDAVTTATGARAAVTDGWKDFGSLEQMAILAAAVQKGGAAVALADAQDCATLAEVAELTGAPGPAAAPAGSAPAPATMQGREFPVWSGSWRAPAQFAFSTDRADPAVVERVVQRVLRLHPELAVEPADPLGLWRAWSDTAMRVLAGGDGRCSQRVGRWLAQTWPKARVNFNSVEMQINPPVDVEERGVDSQLDQTTWDLETRGWRTRVELLRVQRDRPSEGVAAEHDGDPVRYILHVCTSHATTDGFSGHPLMATLQRVWAEEAARGPGEKMEGEDIPSYTSLELLRRRLETTLGPNPGPDAQDFCHYLRPIPQVPGFVRLIQVPDIEGKLVQAVAQRLRCSVTIVLLGMVVGALARTSGLFRERVRLQLLHAMRDLPGEASVVGFFSDNRQVEIPTGELSTVVGPILDLNAVVSRRRGAMPKPYSLSDPNCPFVSVNVVRRNPDVPGAWGYHHLPEHKYQERSGNRDGWVNPAVPVDLQIGETQQNFWTMLTTYEQARLGDEWACQFRDALSAVLLDVVHRPGMPLLPTSSEPPRPGA